jgi:hypothetical protein
VSVVNEDYRAAFDEAGIDGESLTVVLVAGGSPSEVLAALGADPGVVGLDELDFEKFSAYAVAEVAGGVVAFEHSGYADPSRSVLAALSELGGAAAVTRSNIQAHERFGCARAGELEFDANEFTFVDEEEKALVPAELRPLFDSAWVDLDADDEDDASDEWVGLAMAVLYTGVRITTADLVTARELGYHRVPTLTYLD